MTPEAYGDLLVIFLVMVVAWIFTISFVVARYRPDALRWRNQNRVLIADREAYWRHTVALQAMAEAKMRATR